MGNEKKRLKMAMQLKRLCIADISFRQAGALAHYIMDAGIIASDLKYGPMLAGMVITYARNFVDSNEFGTLREPFTQFADSTLHEAHLTTMIVRHRVYAHRDLKAGREFIHDDSDPAQTYEVRIRLHDDGVGCSANALLPDLPSDFLPRFVELCELQHTRAKDELKELLRVIRSLQDYPPREYVVGAEFP